jgi:hypothetical protein
MPVLAVGAPAFARVTRAILQIHQAIVVRSTSLVLFKHKVCTTIEHNITQNVVPKLLRNEPTIKEQDSLVRARTDMPRLVLSSL